MTRTKTSRVADARVRSAWGQVQQAAARVRPAAARVKPLARSTGAAAKQTVRRTRAWAAPQVERTGQVLQDSVAPKVSSMLSSAARRLEPVQRKHRPWRKLAGVSLLTAGASAAAAVARNRWKAGSAGSDGSTGEDRSTGEDGSTGEDRSTGGAAATPKPDREPKAGADVNK